MAEQRLQQRRFAASVWSEDGDAVGPPDVEADRPEREIPAHDDRVVQRGDDLARSGCARQFDLQFPDLAGLGHRLGVQSGETGLERTDLRCTRRRRLDPRTSRRSVVVWSLPLGAQRAPHRLLAGGLHAIAQVTPLVGVAVELFAQMPAGDLLLLEEHLPAARELSCQGVVGIELDDLGDRAGQELAVVTDNGEPTTTPEHEVFEPRESVEIEVVGRLVEQQDVVAAQQHRGQRRSSHLPAR